MGAATTMLDLRRQDQMRTLWTPYWLVSSEIEPEADDKAAVLFSFPIEVFGSRELKVLEVGCQIVTGFAGGTITLDIGAGTIPTDASTDGATCTEVDADEFVPTGDITSGTANMYWPNGGDWFTDMQADLNTGVNVIVPAATTVPCIVAYLTSDATITAGVARVFAYVVEIPLF